LWLLWHLTVLATAAAAMGYSIDGAAQLRSRGETRLSVSTADLSGENEHRTSR
jgi:hypothetical protein